MSLSSTARLLPFCLLGALLLFNRPLVAQTLPLKLVGVQQSVPGDAPNASSVKATADARVNGLVRLTFKDLLKVPHPVILIGTQEAIEMGAGTIPPTKDMIVVVPDDPAITKMTVRDVTIAPSPTPPVAPTGATKPSAAKTAETTPYPAVRLRVYPAPNAAVQDISPKLLKAGTRVKVTGSGFFAPADQITLRVGGVKATVTDVDPNGTWFTATVNASETPPAKPETPPAKPETPPQRLEPDTPLEVLVWDQPASIPDALTDPEKVNVESQVSPGDVWEAAGFAFVLLIVLTLVIVLLYRSGVYLLLGFQTPTPTSGKHPGFVKALLLDTQTNTYSLSRFQFFWWGIILMYAYSLLFLGQGMLDNLWEFPPLSGFGYTFLISLGTLIGAQATTVLNGSKGSGEFNPSPSDLIVNGGVLAPERIQQLAWTILVGLGYLWITFATFHTTAGLPVIPNELLGVMGISSAGYLAGKLSRQPGPNITQVSGETSTDPANSVLLKLVGENFSVNAFVWIDYDSQLGAPSPVNQLPNDAVKPQGAGPADKFVKQLNVTVSGGVAGWQNISHTVMVVNPDGQRAVWEGQLQSATTKPSEETKPSEDIAVAPARDASTAPEAPAQQQDQDSSGDGKDGTDGSS